LCSKENVAKQPTAYQSQSKLFWVFQQEKTKEVLSFILHEADVIIWCI